MKKETTGKFLSQAWNGRFNLFNSSCILQTACIYVVMKKYKSTHISCRGNKRSLVQGALSSIMKCAPFGCCELAICLTNANPQNAEGPAWKSTEPGTCPPRARLELGVGSKRPQRVGPRSCLSGRSQPTRSSLPPNPSRTHLSETGHIFSHRMLNRAQWAFTALWFIVGFCSQCHWARRSSGFQRPVWFSARFLHPSLGFVTLGAVV